MKTLLVGRLLVNERGSLKRKVIDRKAYIYLRKHFFGKSSEKYIGPECAQNISKIEKGISQNKIDQEELRRAKDALKKLLVKNMNYEVFSERLRELFHLMEEQGLWDDHDHLAELAAVFGSLHKTRKRMMVKSAKEADQMVPGSTAVFLEVLDGLE